MVAERRSCKPWTLNTSDADAAERRADPRPRGNIVQGPPRAMLPRQDSVRAEALARQCPRSLPGILDVGKLVKLDVVKRPVDPLDAADVDRLHDIARFRVDHDCA